MRSRPCSAASGARPGSRSGVAICEQSLCICAKASCMPRVCSMLPVKPLRARTIPSSPRQPSTATKASTLIATSSFISVNPVWLESRDGLAFHAAGRRNLQAIVHHLRQFDDAPLRIGGIEHADFDPPEQRVRRRKHVFFAHQMQLALRAIKTALPQRRFFACLLVLCVPVFGGPGSHRLSAQVAAVLRQAADCAQARSQRGANDDERHEDFEQGEPRAMRLARNDAAMAERLDMHHSTVKCPLPSARMATFASPRDMVSTKGLSTGSRPNM